MLKDLGSGTYTIRFLSYYPDEMADFSLSEINCQSTPISIGTSTQVSFNPVCRSKRDSEHRYARYYTFTLDQRQAVSITKSRLTGSYYGYFRLYSGSDITAIPLGGGGRGFWVKNLAPGTYTIEITSSDLDALFELSLSLNHCDVTPLSVGSSTEVSFNPDCRSLLEDHSFFIDDYFNHPYIRYYTFTLDRKHTVTISTSFTVSVFYNFVRLYSGSDVTASPLNSRASFYFDDDYNLYFRAAIFSNVLEPGTYTIEVSTDSLEATLQLSLSLYH